MGIEVWGATARTSSCGRAVLGRTATRYGQGEKYRRPCTGERSHGTERADAARVGFVRERSGAGLDCEPSGDVGCPATGHLRCGDRRCVCWQGYDTGDVEDVDSVYLCRYQRGPSRRAYAMEGGEPLASLYCDIKLPGPQRR